MSDHSSPPKLIFLSIIDGEPVAAEVQNKRAGMGSAGRRADIKHDEKKKKSWRKTEGEQGKENKTSMTKRKRKEEGRGKGLYPRWLCVAATRSIRRNYDRAAWKLINPHSYKLSIGGGVVFAGKYEANGKSGTILVSFSNRAMERNGCSDSKS